ncbi:MAG: hypothetical protein A2Y55_06150 [Actinobacteria bacterium RBG_16_68_12]|nr:MAG: hypothetical protein A2Y55_06150 [Actinobacteria bacterium RBG_16_68_12]
MGSVVSDPARLPFANVARDPASSRPGDRRAEVTDEPTLLRLALWMAEVAAEAALAATAPDAIPTPVVEAAR